MAAPTEPNKKPLRSRRASGGIGSEASGAPWPQRAMTMESPRKTNSAVPTSSEAYIRGCNLSNGCGVPANGRSILTALC